MKKGRKLKKNKFKTFEERIDGLKQEILLLEELIIIHEYFKRIKSSRNAYVVEMRRLAAVELFSKGFSITEIGNTLGRHHSTIIHLLRIQSSKEVEETVALYYRQWIIDKVYPTTIYKIVPSADHPTGWKSISAFVLKELEL